jgi:hypothetical protein
MATESQETVKRDIADRLSNIALYFETRYSLRPKLEQYTPRDSSPDSKRNKDLRCLLTQIQNEEIHTLYELVHLLDNAKTYYRAFGLNNSELAVIEQFKPYKVAANFVNVHKHGTRGRNKSSAKMEYYSLVYNGMGKKPSPSPEAKLIEIGSFINFEGVLFGSMEIIESLIRIWEMFLRYHTEIDVKPFTSRIGAVFEQRGKFIYAAKLPEGVLKDAKRMADNRKHLDL